MVSILFALQDTIPTGSGDSIPPLLIALMFMVVLTILWALLPFAIFGIKPLLRDVINELKHANELLAQIAKNTRSRRNES